MVVADTSAASEVIEFTALADPSAVLAAETAVITDFEDADWVMLIVVDAAGKLDESCSVTGAVKPPVEDESVFVADASIDEVTEAVADESVLIADASIDAVTEAVANESVLVADASIDAVTEAVTGALVLAGIAEPLIVSEELSGAV